MIIRVGELSFEGTNEELAALVRPLPALCEALFQSVQEVFGSEAILKLAYEYIDGIRPRPTEAETSEPTEAADSQEAE